MRIENEDYLFSVAQSRELDRLMVDHLGITEYELMHRAASATLESIRVRFPTIDSICVLSGSGRNGGDGFLLAALALQVGLEVTVFTTKDVSQLQQPMLAAAETCQAAKVAMHVWQPDSQDKIQADLIVDALLGTGIQADVRDIYADMIAQVNAQKAKGTPVLSIDIPSGLHPDTGRIQRTAVNADITITFIGAKKGLFTGEARDVVGEIVYEPLGVTDAILDSIQSPVTWVSEKSLKRLKPRSNTAHKGDMGHVAVVGGELGMGGAAMLAAEAALYAGAGLVSVFTREAHVAPLLARLPEVMVNAVDDLGHPGLNISRATVVVVGPGLGKTSWSLTLLKHALDLNIPVVVDADGINIIAEQYVHWPSAHHAQRVLTPHPKEAANLLGNTVADIEADRYQSAEILVKEYNATVLLKGAGTIVAGKSKDQSSEQVIFDVIDTGNSGMATGGMGDVLSGVIGGLIAQGGDCFSVTGLAAWLHGRAADQLAEKRGGKVGLRASEVIKELVFN